MGRMRADERVTLRRTPVYLVLGAVALAWVAPDTLIGSLGAGKVMLGPFRATLIGAAATYGFFIWYYREWGFGLLSGVLLLASLAGHTPLAIHLSVVSLLKRTVGLVPKTCLAWGIVAVSAAFVTLGAGACVSLLLWHRYSGNGIRTHNAGG
jgi:hypothetical protein